MPVIEFETKLTADRMIRVPEEYDVVPHSSVFVMIDTTRADVDELKTERERIDKRADELLASGGCPELDALDEFRVFPADFVFDREEIHERR